jgi:hypothetical protein
MKTKTVTVTLASLTLFGCASPLQKATPWQDVNFNAKITCPMTVPSGISFVARLGKISKESNLAPESRIFISSQPSSGTTFVVKKELKKYVSSYGDYVASLSELEISLQIEDKEGSFIITPTKKRQHQASLIGEWPIPQMDISELTDYLGDGCTAAR